MTDCHDYLLKMVLVGDSSVGKTSLLLRYTDDTFSETFVTTIGVDFKIKTRVNDDGISMKVQLWDTAGQDRFRAIVSTFYRGAHGLMFVYDVTDMESFNNIPQWMQEAEHCGVNSQCQKLLIANKIDLTTKRVVTEEQGKEMARRLGLEYIETSAKTAQRVHEALDSLADSIVRTHRAEGVFISGPASLTGGKAKDGPVRLDTKPAGQEGYCSGYCGRL